VARVWKSLLNDKADDPPTRAELRKIAHIKALIIIGQAIEETQP
jgi:hypothetical protein